MDISPNIYQGRNIIRIPKVDKNKSFIYKRRSSLEEFIYKPISRASRKNTSYLNPKTEAALRVKKGKNIYIALEIINAVISQRKVFLWYKLFRE